MVVAQISWVLNSLRCPIGRTAWRLNRCGEWLKESCDFGVVGVSLERMLLQLPNHMVESGPFIWAEVDKFAPKASGPTPSHNGLGNLDGRFIPGCMDAQREDRPRLHIDEAEDTATSNGKIVESAIARYNIRRVE